MAGVVAPSREVERSRARNGVHPLVWYAWLPRTAMGAYLVVLVGSALMALDAGPATWCALLFNGFAWPQVAYRWAVLMESAALGGWIAWFGFQPWVAVTILAMIPANAGYTGGMRLAAPQCPLPS